MDWLGKEYNVPLKSARDAIAAESLQPKVLLQEISNSTAQDSLQLKKATEILHSHKERCHPGFTIAIDNFYLQIKRRNMTAPKQNVDIHWVNHNMFVNRVSGNLLSTKAPKRELITVSNVDFLPSDQLKQRHNYAVLETRVFVDCFDVYVPLKDACLDHIHTP